MRVQVDVDTEYNADQAYALAVDTCTTLVTAMGNDTITYATPATPVATGRLRAGTQLVVDEPDGWSVTGHVQNLVEYALDVHDGTRPHRIEPRDPDGVLRFEGSDGGIVYTKYVNHPGTRPRPFLAEGAAAAAPENGFIFTTE
jgi:hypothetical protein